MPGFGFVDLEGQLSNYLEEDLRKLSDFQDIYNAPIVRTDMSLG